MNREELEKMFDDKFPLERSQIWDWKVFQRTPSPEAVKQFIFETIIPEVLKSVMLEKREENNHIDLAYNNYWKYIKNKAKELYNINL
jgi:hypothetical protein